MNKLFALLTVISILSFTGNHKEINYKVEDIMYGKIEKYDTKSNKWVFVLKGSILHENDRIRFTEADPKRKVECKLYLASKQDHITCSSSSNEICVKDLQKKEDQPKVSSGTVFKGADDIEMKTTIVSALLSECPCVNNDPEILIESIEDSLIIYNQRTASICCSIITVSGDRNVTKVNQYEIMRNKYAYVSRPSDKNDTVLCITELKNDSNIDFRSITGHKLENIDASSLKEEIFDKFIYSIIFK